MVCVLRWPKSVADITTSISTEANKACTIGVYLIPYTPLWHDA